MRDALDRGDRPRSYVDSSDRSPAVTARFGGPTSRDRLITATCERFPELWCCRGPVPAGIVCRAPVFRPGLVWQACLVRNSELVVDDPARRRAGTAVYLSLAVVSVFAVVTWFTKEMPSLDVRQPWQDDPYDVVVSLDFVVLPLLVLLGATRTQLCPRYSALPSRRIVDLLRVCVAAVGACLVTQAAEWVAVVLRLHHASWNAATLGQVMALLAGTVAMTAAVARLRAASRGVLQVSDPGPQPDWLADTVALGLHASARLDRYGPYANRLVRWVDLRILTRGP